ncbi:hypothetical protein Tco_1158058, partial [Tanacetum coccineum]
AADHVVAPTPGSAITIPETANKFAIKGTDNANITRKRSKPDKHGHGKGKDSTKAGDLIARKVKSHLQSTLGQQKLTH